MTCLRAALRHVPLTCRDTITLQCKLDCEKMVRVLQEEIRRLTALSDETILKTNSRRARSSMQSNTQLHINRNTEIDYEGFKPDIAATRRIAEKYVKTVQVNGAEVVRIDVPKPSSTTKKKTVLSLYNPGQNDAISDLPTQYRPAVNRKGSGSVSSKYMEALSQSNSPKGNNNRKANPDTSIHDPKRGMEEVIVGNKSVEKEKLDRGPPSMAAMAAAAALKRSKNKEVSSGKDMNDVSSSGPPSMAAMAAAAIFVN